MLGVVDGARVRAGEAHAAWSESFNELFAQVAGLFRERGGAAARAGVPAGAAVADGAEERVDAGGVRRGRLAGRVAAAAELLAVG